VVAIRIIEMARRGELEYRRLVERCLKDAGAAWARLPSASRPRLPPSPFPRSQSFHPRPGQHHSRLIPAVVLVRATRRPSVPRQPWSQAALHVQQHASTSRRVRGTWGYSRYLFPWTSNADGGGLFPNDLMGTAASPGGCLCGWRAARRHPENLLQAAGIIRTASGL
jgi:hypothetical protein